MSSDDRAENILAERARRLARPLTPPDDSLGEEIAVLVSGGERYGVPLIQIARIHGDVTLTPVPGLRAPWDGLVSLRGELYPVLDLPAYLGRQSRADGTHCVLLAAAGLRVAVMSDTPPALARVPAGSLAPAPGPSPAPPGSVAGVTPDLLAVLDVEVVLSDPRLVVDDE